MFLQSPHTIQLEGQWEVHQCVFQMSEKPDDPAAFVERAKASLQINSNCHMVLPLKCCKKWSQINKSSLISPDNLTREEGLIF